MAYGWLHKGSLVCPSCKELCEQEFNERGETCRKNEEPPSANHYPKDHLKCSATSYNSQKAFVVTSFALILLSLR